MTATGSALAAIALWATLSSLGLLLQHVPPFLLTGVALFIGSALTWPTVIRNRQAWAVSKPVLALGVITLFGFHFLLFMALRLAPAVEVNLVNYLWPLLIVVLSPFYLPGQRLRSIQVLAAILGFAGAALAIWGAGGSAGAGGAGSAVSDGGSESPSTGHWLGYALAIGSAFLWANYSLQTKRLALAGRSFSAAAIGLFGLISGLLALLCHVLLEPSVALSWRDGLLLLLMGLGPLGGAFLLWDRALKLGDARHIGTLSYLTPLGSTVLLLTVTGRGLTWSIALAAAMIIGAALLATKSR